MEAANKEDIVIAFAFGTPATAAKIRPNIYIGEVAAKKALELGAAIYTEYEINVPPGIEAIYDSAEVRFRAPTTLRMARRFIETAKNRGVKRIWLVAAIPNLWRCKRDIERAATEAAWEVEISVCAMESRPYDAWFDRNSAENHTRYSETWDARDWLLKRTPFWLYDIIAG